MDVTVEVEDGSDVTQSGPQYPPSNSFLNLKLGWICVVIVALSFALFRKWRSNREIPVSSESSTLNGTLQEDAVKRREAIEAARMRLQERFNQDALQHKQKIVEEEKRKAERRAEIWDAMNSGRSCNLIKKHEPEDENPLSGTRKFKGKSKLRPDDYNPLMGDTSYRRFRPTSRFSGG